MTRPTRDFLWKAAIRKFIYHFVLFFYPHHCKKVDWSKGFEFLDKELHKIYADAQQKHRVADALVKLHLKNGKELWMLFYTEIQGYNDEEFAQRMHQIRYRIEDLFGKSPAMLAVFTDDDPNYHPKKYRLNTWGAISETQFTSYKVMNHPPSTYADPKNPIALIMKVVYWSTQTVKDSDLMSLHFSAIRELFANNYSKEEVKFLFQFIKHYVRFGNKKNYPIFDSKIDDMVKYETTEEILGFFDYETRYKNEASEKEAALQLLEAEKQKVEAEKQKTEAEKQKVEAEKQKVEAEKQKVEAEKQKAEAAEREVAEEKERARAWRERIERNVIGLIKRGIDRNMIADVLLMSLEDIQLIEDTHTSKN